MNVHLLNYDPNKIGGGWTQARYLYERLASASYEEADTVLLAGSTLASYDQVQRAKKDGKKIVLRVDNHLLASRNRNTGMSRMKVFAESADLLIYQSQWARDYLKDFTCKDGPVFLNGVDLSIFNDKDKPDNGICLYVRSSRIPEKGWDMARFWYSQEFNSHTMLNIVGKFSAENIDYDFDFYNQEPYKFWGEQPRENLASIMRSSKYFLYSYFMDACSNTLLEARASGCQIVDVYGMLQTGGAPEIMACEDISIERMISEYQEALSKL